MPISVFLADDHAIVRDGLRMVLEAQTGLEVIGETGDGRSAVREVTRLRPDVIVMDIAMPELNGIEATRMLREANVPVKILILSMHSQTEYIFRALQAGADGYLVKHSVSREVADAIRAVSRGGRYLSPGISDKVIDDYVRRRAQPAEEDLLLRLSTREREVLQLIVEGRSTLEIADIVALSPKTVETYRSRMMRKLEIGSLPELVKFAIQHGLTSLE
ncbi:MAG: response regulator transcription factor [bacterium]|nr:response regulator transcription factor [bacterium]